MPKQVAVRQEDWQLVDVDWYGAIRAYAPLGLRPPGVRELLERVCQYHSGERKELSRMDTANIHNYICALEEYAAELRQRGGTKTGRRLTPLKDSPA